jgi:hypothetical protein
MFWRNSKCEPRASERAIQFDHLLARSLAGHLFEPGPIVNGHNRQPTQAEIDERTRVLWASRASLAPAVDVPSADERATAFCMIEFSDRAANAPIPRQ